MALLVYVVLYVVLSTSGLLLLRSALADSELRMLVGEPRFLLGAVLYALSFATWLLSLRRYELSAVYPTFVGVGYGAVTLSSLVILHEHLTAAKAVGIVLVGLGVVLVLR